MMEKQLARLTFEQAKRAKNVGFDWPTNAYFKGSDTVKTPYYPQAETALIDEILNILEKQ
jgi:hypothetical protein